MKSSKIAKFLITILITIISFILLTFIIFSVIGSVFSALGVFNTGDNSAIERYFQLMQFLQNSFTWIGLILGIVISSRVLGFEFQNKWFVIGIAILFYTFNSYLMGFTTTFALPSFGGYTMITLHFILPIVLVYYSMNKLEFKK